MRSAIRDLSKLGQNIGEASSAKGVWYSTKQASQTWGDPTSGSQRHEPQMGTLSANQSCTETDLTAPVLCDHLASGQFAYPGNINFTRVYGVQGREKFSSGNPQPT